VKWAVYLTGPEGSSYITEFATAGEAISFVEDRHKFWDEIGIGSLRETHMFSVQEKR